MTNCKTLAEAEETIATLRETIADLRDTNDHQAAAIKAADEHLGKAVRERDVARDQRDTALTTIGELREMNARQADTIRGRAAPAFEALAEAEDTIATLSEMNERQAVTIKAGDDQNAILIAHLAGRRERIKELKAEAEEHQETIAALRSQVQGLTEALEDARKAAAGHATRADRLGRNLHARVERIKELEVHFEALANRNAELEAAIDRIRDVL